MVRVSDGVLRLAGTTATGLDSTSGLRCGGMVRERSVRPRGVHADRLRFSQLERAQISQRTMPGGEQSLNHNVRMHSQ